MPFPESIVVDVVKGSDLDRTSAERRVYEFCIGDYRKCRTGEKGMADTLKVQVLIRVGISNSRVHFLLTQGDNERTHALYLSSSGCTATARSPGIVSGLVVETTISPLPSSSGKAKE